LSRHYIVTQLHSILLSGPVIPHPGGGVGALQGFYAGAENPRNTGSPDEHTERQTDIHITILRRPTVGAE